MANGYARRRAPPEDYILHHGKKLKTYRRVANDADNKGALDIYMAALGPNIPIIEVQQVLFGYLGLALGTNRSC